MTDIKLTGIAFRPKPGMPMQIRQSANISKEYGLEGDSRGNLSIRKSNNRQVTVLSQESWSDAISELEGGSHKATPDLFEKTLHWSARRANLLITGKTFSPEDVGKQFRIGNLLLEITGETDPCSKMDAIQPGLKQALYPEWRGGVCTKVISGGQVNVGDCVTIENNHEQS